ncbi:hypothetical protein [uncultured Aquimarina sp.]|uniref:hypothetical protein n=1 Tax=uncultured Aquimarina sp. TaxID=575652 RepID=UPI00260CE0BC|nr:hypothetical protein [uncultured Aquimarina sp.]
MRYFIILTVLLGAYEFLFKEYLFVVYRETYFGFRALDEKLFSGSTNVFRAKVFFEGPLALSQFAIGAAFLFRKHIKVLFLILLISIFANGRLGIIICAGIIALYYVKKYNLLTILLKPKYFFLLIFGLLFSFTVIYLLLDESSIERFKNSFDTSNEGNAARITFWINGIKTWLSYDLAHLIFGNNGYYGSIYKNNAENGWITLLVNNGIIGFLYYFIPVLLLSINYLIKASVNFWYIFLLFFCMFVQTFHLGASANLFYWLIIFSFLNTTYDNKISL